MITMYMRNVVARELCNDLQSESYFTMLINFFAIAEELYEHCMNAKIAVLAVLAVFIQL